MNNPPKGKENQIKEPAVLGAIIDLGYCLDLLDSKYLEIIKNSYDNLCKTNEAYGTEIPQNKKLKMGNYCLDILIEQ